MKNKFALILVFSFIMVISGCKSQKDLTSSNVSSIVSDNIISPDISSEVELVESKEEPVSSSQPTISSTVEETGECKHTYSKDITEPTCKSEGFTVYSCTKCGNNYKSDIKPASHIYGKYFCESCGIIDKSLASKYAAMNAWINEYGELLDNGTYTKYPNKNSKMGLCAISDSSDFSIDCGDTDNGLWFSMHISEDNITNINFGFGTTTHANCEIKKSDFSLDRKIVFDYFHTDADIDQDVFATDCANLLKEYIPKIQNEILIPITGLTLNDFGFTSL